MQQLSSTPVLRHARRAAPSCPAPAPTDLRWQLLDLVRTCRQRLDLRDRDIAVLRGLLSLMPATASADQRVVFASNKVLIERCDGIDERTLRRRLAHLQAKGLVTRHLSPNGKRYQVRDETSQARLTYGIDLSPMFEVETHLRALAEDCQREMRRQNTLKALLRDALYHAPEALPDALRDEGRRALRRVLSAAELEDMLQRVSDACGQRPEAPALAAPMPASDGQNDRHIQRSNKETPDSEGLESKEVQHSNDISVRECLDLAPTVRSLAPVMPQTWAEVIALADTLGPAIGLQRSSLALAQARLGRHGCALAVLGLVEAFNRIRNPEAYLRALVNTAEKTGLNLVRMFRSLVRAPRIGALAG